MEVIACELARGCMLSRRRPSDDVQVPESERGRTGMFGGRRDGGLCRCCLLKVSCAEGLDRVARDRLFCRGSFAMRLLFAVTVAWSLCCLFGSMR